VTIQHICYPLKDDKRRVQAVAGTAGLHVRGREGQPAEGSARRKALHPTMHGKKDIGKGLENAIKRQLGLK
jgi:hypothetical protein